MLQRTRAVVRSAQCRRRGMQFEVNGARPATVPEQKPLETTDDWQELAYARIQNKELRDRFNALEPDYTKGWSTRDPLHRPTPPSHLTISTLIAAGAHFGHSHKLLDNNFLPYAYGERAGIIMIDMDRTLPLLRRAINVTRAITARDGAIVFVGTRPHLSRLVHKAAKRVGRNAYAVGERWLPGTLTNRVQFFGPEMSQTHQIVPDLMIILNPLANMHVIRECAISHVPTIGIIDSNVDPRIVMYPIPANDDSTRTAEVIAGVLSIAGREGVELSNAAKAKQSQSQPRTNSAPARS